MAKVFSLKDMEFELRQSPIPEFLWHISPTLSETAGAEHLKFDIKSLDPGKYSYPYHFHRKLEEMFVIISGKALLRTYDEFIEVSEHDILFFETGPKGAHQLLNHTDKPCIYLDIRTVADIDICEYPDSGKINIIPYEEIFEIKDQVDYYKGEESPQDKWPEEVMKRFKK